MFAVVCSVVGMALLGWSAWLLHAAQQKLAQRVQPSWLPVCWWLVVPLVLIAGGPLGFRDDERIAFLGALGLWGGELALFFNFRRLWSKSAWAPAALWSAGLAGVAFALSLPFVHHGAGTASDPCGLPFFRMVACPPRPSEWLNGIPYAPPQTDPLVLLLGASFATTRYNIGACLLAPQLVLLTFRCVLEPRVAPSPLEARRSVGRIDYVLLLATLVGVLLNTVDPTHHGGSQSVVARLPVAWPDVSGYGCDSVLNHSLLVASPLGISICVFWALLWVLRSGLTRRGRLLWALALLVGLLGWPTSCLMADCNGPRGGSFLVR